MTFLVDEKIVNCHRKFNLVDVHLKLPCAWIQVYDIKCQVNFAGHV